jgi:hypothetical protein
MFSQNVVTEPFPHAQALVAVRKASLWTVGACLFDTCAYAQRHGNDTAVPCEKTTLTVCSDAMGVRRCRLGHAMHETISNQMHETCAQGSVCAFVLICPQNKSPKKAGNMHVMKKKKHTRRTHGDRHQHPLCDCMHVSRKTKKTQYRRYTHLCTCILMILDLALNPSVHVCMRICMYVSTYEA